MKKFPCLPEPISQETRVENDAQRFLVDNIGTLQGAAVNANSPKQEAQSPSHRPQAQQGRFAEQKFEMPSDAPSEEIGGQQKQDSKSGPAQPSQGSLVHNAIVLMPCSIMVGLFADFALDSRVDSRDSELLRKAYPSVRKLMISDQDIIVPLKSDTAEEIRRAPVPSSQQQSAQDEVVKQTPPQGNGNHQVEASKDEARTIEAMNKGEHHAMEWPAQGSGN